MKAMIFAAGLGTRMKPITDTRPKALLIYNGAPLIEHVIRRLKSFGVTQVVVNVHHFSAILTEYLKQNNFGVEILISDESDLLLDTGGGLKKAGSFFKQDEDFILHNVDVLSEIDLADLMRTHKKNKALATLAVSERETSRYLLFDNRDCLIGWVNEKNFDVKYPGPNKWPEKKRAFSGVQVLNSKIFKKISQEGKFSIIDVYLDLLATEKIIAYDHTGAAWKDMGKPEMFTSTN